MFGRERRFYLDALERLIWTAIQLASPIPIVEFFDWDRKWIPIIGIGIALVKVAIVGPLVGNGNTASTLPASADPAGEPPVDPDPGDDGDGGLAEAGWLALCAVSFILGMLVYAVLVK